MSEEEKGPLVVLAEERPVSPPPCRGRITVFWGKGRRFFDDDNLAGGLKPLIDAMRDIELIRNDTPRWFRLAAEQKRDRENPRVEIELGEIE